MNNRIIAHGNSVYEGPAVVDTAIMVGFNPVTELVYISSFYNRHNSTWYLLGGNSNGAVFSWKWTGSTWVSSPEFIADGYVQNVTFDGYDIAATPSMFYIGSQAYMIVGEYYGYFTGYQWGTTMSHPSSWFWDGSSAIISGLPADVGSRSVVCGLEMDGTAYLLVGTDTDNASYFRWTGSAWLTDTFIGTGIPSIGRAGNFNYFEMGNEKFLVISSTYSSVAWLTYKWGGSSWVANDYIMSGIPKIGNEKRSTAFFNINGNNYIIHNQGPNRTGYRLP